MTSQTDSQTNPQCPNDDESKTERLLRHLANARAKARAHGLSPRERAAQKVTAALTWLYRWEWCAPATLDVTANDTRGGYAQRLKRAGLVHITEIIGSPGTRHRPRHAVSLTSAGVERATEAITEESQIRGEVKTGVRAVPQHQIEHDHRLQLLVLEWLQIDMIENYLTPAELAIRSQAHEKQPDLLVWGGTLWEKTAIELELTAKSRTKALKFIRDCEWGIRETRWNHVQIICRSPAIASRYLRLIDEVDPKNSGNFLVSRLED